MKPLKVHTGQPVVLNRSNIDTDQIIPAQYCLTTSRTGFASKLFGNWRQDPEFVLNSPPFDRASVLLTGPDFGTGSSREHAVWALQDFGFRVIISQRFGDIFQNNASRTGLLCVQLSAENVQLLMASVEQLPDVPMRIDVLAKTVRHGDEAVAFELDDFTQRRFLEGLDDIALTLELEADIRQYELARAPDLPRISLGDPQ